MIRPEYSPNYRRAESLPMARLPSAMIEHEGNAYIVSQAEGLTTGLVGTAESAPRPVITLWQEPVPERGRSIGIALSFTPDDDHLNMIINSLTRMRDQRRAEAKAQADAALRKAAGK